MKAIGAHIIHSLPANPFIFKLQQRVCNDYSAVRCEFSDDINRAEQSILDVGCSTGTWADQIVDIERNDYTGALT